MTKPSTSVIVDLLGLSSSDLGPENTRKLRCLYNNIGSRNKDVLVTANATPCDLIPNQPLAVKFTTVNVHKGSEEFRDVFFSIADVLANIFNRPVSVHWVHKGVQHPHFAYPCKKHASQTIDEKMAREPVLAK